MAFMGMKRRCQKVLSVASMRLSSLAYSIENNGPVNNTIKANLTPNKYIKNNGIANLKYLDSNDFISTKYGNNFKPAYARTDVLPQEPTDIKGVDSGAYRHFHRRQITTQLPSLVSNEFFSLRFIPYKHYLSLSRKSNIAYTFTNKGGYKLNDRVLEKALSSYKGKYQNLSFFQENLHPLNTAIGRTKYRKFVKRSLFVSLRDLVKDEKDLQNVSGIFFFKFTVVPFRYDQKDKVQNDLNKAINTLINDTSLRRNLDNVCRKQNKEAKKGEQLLKQLRLCNTLGAKNVPGYFTKLPFINQKQHLL